MKVPGLGYLPLMGSLEEDKEYLKQILSKVREAFPRDDNELDEPIINYLNNVITVIVPWSY